jgi:hypothetical protein
MDVMTTRDHDFGIVVVEEEGEDTEEDMYGRPSKRAKGRRKRKKSGAIPVLIPEGSVYATH